MKGSCSYQFENGSHCNKTYHLHNIYFRDPFTPSNSETTDLCKWHYDEVIGQTMERLKAFQSKLSNMIAESARLRRIARENDTYVNNDALQHKIEDLRLLIKKIQTDECKNFFCNQNLRQLEKQSKIYSAHTFKPSGRRHYTLYYCSLKCFYTIKARCGLPVPIHRGQTMLDTLVKN